jgi:hypothetical protein
VRRIDIDPSDALSRQLWSSVGDLAELLPSEWVLVGGLMVQLHAMEAGLADVRVTQDVDVLGQARPRGALDAIHEALDRAGFESGFPDVDGYAHRYTRDGLIVDVLAPDRVKPPPTVGAGRLAVGIPGGSQALARQEEVAVTIAGRQFVVRRPTLLGAILIKSRSLMVHHDPESQREDLLLLLSLVEDPRALAAELRRSERGWLRKAAPRLEFERPALVDADVRRRARLTLRLLIGERDGSGGA